MVASVVTTTALRADKNPSTVGQLVTFFAHVVSTTGGIPTGTVTFKDGATTLGTGAVDAYGNASYATSALAAGDHSMTAVYGGDALYITSTSAALTQHAALSHVAFADHQGNMKLLETTTPDADGVARMKIAETAADGAMLIANHAATVSPSDTVDLASVADALIVAGTVSAGVIVGITAKVRTESGEDVTITGPNFGFQINLRVKRVFLTGSTATAITALWRA